MDINKARKILLKNPEFKREYYKKDLAFEISKMLIEARILKNMTQAKLAALVGTKQPSIARIERGEYLPSLSLLQRIAQAFNSYLLPPKFAFVAENPKIQILSNTGQKVSELSMMHSQERLFIETNYSTRPKASGDYNSPLQFAGGIS